MKKQFGLIGHNISHSFSAEYFNNKFKERGIEAIYKLFDLESAEGLEKIKLLPGIVGLNVTSPFKRDVIPFLDELSGEAELLKAVNVIEITKDPSGKLWLKGHNTDSRGFEMTLNHLPESISNALILGSGGAASAVALALHNKGINYSIVSRNPSGNEISYAEARKLLPSHHLVVNATPVGMLPEINQCPDIDYEKLTSNHLCYDLIYNPAETLFLQKAKKRGADTKNGLEMLLNQAKLAWDIWNNNEREID